MVKIEKWYAGECKEGSEDWARESMIEVNKVQADCRLCQH